MRFQNAAALTATATLALTMLAAAPATAATTYRDRVAAWSECKTYERLGPFRGRVALGGKNPAYFPPCGYKPGGKYYGPAF